MKRQFSVRPKQTVKANTSAYATVVTSDTYTNNVYMLMDYEAADGETGMEGDSFDFVAKFYATSLDDANLQVADYNNLHGSDYYADYYDEYYDDGSEPLESLDSLSAPTGC